MSRSAKPSADLIKAALSLPDAQVLVADSAGTVPAGSDPFITVNVIDGAAVDHQSAPVGVGGSPRLRVSTQRRVRVSVNAYGYQAEEYLQTVGGRVVLYPPGHGRREGRGPHAGEAHADP